MFASIVCVCWRRHLASPPPPPVTDKSWWLVPLPSPLLLLFQPQKPFLTDIPEEEGKRKRPPGRNQRETEDDIRTLPDNEWTLIFKIANKMLIECTAKKAIVHCTVHSRSGDSRVAYLGVSEKNVILWTRWFLSGRVTQSAKGEGGSKGSAFALSSYSSSSFQSSKNGSWTDGRKERRSQVDWKIRLD